jgi:hypothetical protein
MPKILSSNLSSQRSMWARSERSLRTTISSSSQSSMGSAPSAAMTDTSSSSSLSFEFEAMVMRPQQWESKPCISRTKSSKFDLCDLAAMAGSEGASRSTSLTTLSRKESVLNVDVRETDGEWGQFVEVASWLEDPMPPRAFSRSISFTRPYSQTRNGRFVM